MNEVTLTAKSREEAIAKAQEALIANLDEIVYHITEEKGKLFKSSTYHIQAMTLKGLEEKVLEFLKTTIENLGLTVSFNSKLENKKLIIDMDSDNNALLIGKNGKTLKSLETLTKQYIYSQYECHIELSLDVENYKEKRIENLEKLARKTAKEVRLSKVEATLENMNSYERRIVHNALTNFKGVTTTSEGEEPNRHVIIKPTE